MSKIPVRSFLFFFLMLFAIFLQAQPAIRSGMESQDQEKSKTKEVAPGVSLWYLDGFGAFRDSTKLDTLQDYVHIFNPVYKTAWTATYLGNYGLPSEDNNFFNRNYRTSYFFAHSREAYIITPSKLKYFNTNTPYTRLDYTQSENKSKNNETRFNVIHSQNINPWWNFTFRADLAKSDGQYLYQSTKNNSTSIYSTYIKDNWSVHAGFITNRLGNDENGGLTSDSLLQGGKDPRYWNVNLNSSSTSLRNNYFFSDTEYRIGKLIDTVETQKPRFRPIFGIIHSFEMNTNKHDFTDKESTEDAFFRNNYYSDSYTTDSIRFHRITNTFQLKQYENDSKKFSFGKRVFIGFEIDHGSMPGKYVENRAQKDYPTWIFGPAPADRVKDSLVLRTDIHYTNTFIGGGIFRETGRFWKWNFTGKFYTTGRNAGQTELSGLIYKPLPFLGDSLASISFSGSIENRVPDYFQENFMSNHYKWAQNLSMEQRMIAGGVFRMPQRNFELGANYAIINNFIYNDTLGIPDQTSKELLILSAYIDKDFHYRGLHLRTRILWQKASDETYIHLPEWSAFISGYFQFTISKVMLAQLGSDLRYNTSYYADAYSPATGLFYLQNEKKYGDYPYIDVYASLRLKRTRVFFKYMNVGTNFLDGVYMTTSHYPMNRATFRLGVSWAFYD